MIDYAIDKMQRDIADIKYLIETALKAMSSKPPPEVVPLKVKRRTQFGVYDASKPFKCEICGRGFANKGHLGSHLHHGCKGKDAYGAQT